MRTRASCDPRCVSTKDRAKGRKGLRRGQSGPIAAKPSKLPAQLCGERASEIWPVRKITGVRSTFPTDFILHSTTMAPVAEKAQTAPATHKQPSRKGKKAWRKNVDITELQEGVEDVREQIIQGYEPVTYILRTFQLTPLQWCSDRETCRGAFRYRHQGRRRCSSRLQQAPQASEGRRDYCTTLKSPRGRHQETQV